MIENILRLLIQAINIYYYIIIARAIISWINPYLRNPLVDFIYRITDPVLAKIRQFLPHSRFDWSPIIAIVVLWILEGILRKMLFRIAFQVY